MKVFIPISDVQPVTDKPTVDTITPSTMTSKYNMCTSITYNNCQNIL